MEQNTLSSQRWLGALGFAMVVLLVVQYVLGMYTNLFVQIPAGVNGWQWLDNSVVLVGHVVVGGLLTVAAVAILLLAWRARARAWIAISAVGLVAIGAALVAGSSFIESQSAASSFIMASGFGAALLAYVSGIYASRLAPGS